MPETATQAPPDVLHDLARLRADARRIVAGFERDMRAYPALYRPDGDDDAAAAYRLVRWFLQTDLDAS